MTELDFILIGFAALGGGFVNALAGGGTLITFPMLTAVGVPPVAANVTNTVALCPGFMGGTLAQRRDLRGQGKRMGMLLPTGVVGGLTGGVLLLHTSDATFRKIVPFLILAAVLLLAFQDRIRSVVTARMTNGRTHPHEVWAIPPIFVGALYGGYFGAGLGVMMLAILGLVLDDTLTRLNALKQSLSFVINVSAAVFFLFSGKVLWTAAAVMAVGALLGGVLGGRMASRVSPIVLRRIVISIGLVVAGVYLFK